jgi:phosphate transport system substrate-binding protein
MATLENQAGRFVEPGEEAGRAALLASENFFTADPPGDASYPITTFSWLLLYKKYADQKKAAALKDWVSFGLTTGQTFASALGYIPLPPETAALARHNLDALS